MSSIDSILISDAVFPSQFYSRSPHPQTKAIRRLMLAVLEDAIRCFQKHYNAQQVAAARIWFEASEDGLFSYESICIELRIDAQILWERLLAGPVQLQRKTPTTGFGKVTVGLKSSW